MGGNEKAIEPEVSVCLYFLSIGDWNKHAKCVFGETLGGCASVAREVCC